MFKVSASNKYKMESWLESLKYVEEPTETVRDLKECVNEIHAAFKRNGNAKIICKNRTYYIWQESGSVQIKYIARESYSLNETRKKMHYTYPNARRLMRIEHYLKNASATDKNVMLICLKKRKDHLMAKGSAGAELAHIERLINTYDSMELLD